MGAMVKSGITRDEIISWGGEEVFNQAMALGRTGDVVDVEYDDDKLEIRGKIERSGGWAMPVSLTLKGEGRIVPRCPCIKNQKFGLVCEHVVAIAFARLLQEEDAIAEERKSAGGATRGGSNGAGSGGLAGSGGDFSGPGTVDAEDDADFADSAEGAEEEEEDFIRVKMTPKFSAFISGSRAALSIEIDAHYGEIEFPACSVQIRDLVMLPHPDDPMARRVRSIEAERYAVSAVRDWGFAPGNNDSEQKFYMTDPKDVLDFLGGGIPALRRKGWHVDLSDRLMKTLDEMPSVVPVVKIRDAPDGSFDVAYQFDAMGEDVSPVEIQAALNRGDGYVMRDGKVFLLDNDGIEKMHKAFSDCSSRTDNAPPGWFRVRGVHAPFVKATLLNLADNIDLDDTEADRWRETAELLTQSMRSEIDFDGDLERRRRENGAQHDGDAGAKFEPIALGKLESVLRPYQKQGVYWMRFLENSGFCGLLADEMGLGKTLQTLTWLSLPRSVPSELPALIVCPTSLVRNWEAEAKKFTPWLKTLVIHGPERAASFGLIDGADIVITSYALLQRDFGAAYLEREFSAVVLDEAQHIKNRETRNAKAAKLLRSRQRLVLTGTPVENSVADVWSLFDFLMPDYLGNYESFRAGYEMPMAEQGSAAANAQERLRNKIGPFTLRRLKKSVAKDLPDKIIKVSYCPMSEEAQREYTQARLKARHEAGSMIKANGLSKSRFKILAILMKLRLIASRSKVEAFMEQLQSAIEGGHKILVFSQFVKILDLLRGELADAGIPFCYLDGATKDRLGECNRFNRDPKIQVFLISLMAGGTGLNLTSADIVMHYDPWWNPAVEAQATDRAHRIGQKKTVYVMKLIAAGSIEEKVLDLQRRKQEVINATIGTTDAAVMEKLTAADIGALLS